MLPSNHRCRKLLVTDVAENKVVMIVLLLKGSHQSTDIIIMLYVGVHISI